MKALPNNAIEQTVGKRGLPNSAPRCVTAAAHCVIGVIGVKSLRAVAQIILAKVLSLIYKHGKDNK
jgi:hypothetical protein